MTTFEIAFDNLIKDEGIYSNDAYDPGGETKYGISHRSYPKIDIQSLTLQEAKDIYKKDFWDSLKLDNFSHIAIAQKLFNIAVNMGIKRAVICLQRAIKSVHYLDEELVEDGILGEKTYKAVHLRSEDALLSAFRSEVAGYYRSLNNKKYIKGWLRRAYS